MTYLLRPLLVAPVLLAVAVVGQVTLVNRLPLPGGAAPDLVLLLVGALAVTGGPVPGMLAGFLGGLALDVAPPGSGLAGENALICCLVGYGCGALAIYQQQLSPRGAPPGTPWGIQGQQGPLALLPVLAIGAVAGEALRGGLGMMLSDPGITVPAIKHVLPVAIVYDLLASPFILLPVAALRGTPEPDGIAFSAASSAARPGASARSPLRAAGSRATPQAGAIPRLTFADTRPAPLRAAARPDLAIRFSSRSALSPSSTRPATALPNLHLHRSGRASLRGLTGAPGGNGPWGDSALRGGSAFRGDSALRGDKGPRGRGWLRGSSGGRGGSGWPGCRPPKVGFGSGGRDGAIGGSVIGGGVSSLRGAAFSGSGSSARGGPGGRVFRRSGGGFLGGGGAFGGALGQSLFAGTGSRGPGRNWLRGNGGQLAGQQLASPGRGVARGWSRGPGRAVKGPKRGWLRTGTAGTPRGRRPTGPGKGWLKPSKPPRLARLRTPGRGWLHRRPPKLVWKRKSPGNGWSTRNRMGGRR